MQRDSIFKKKLSEALSKQLPGLIAHLPLAPDERKKDLSNFSYPSSAKQGAVLILIFEEGNQLKLLFILRSIYNGIHSGQISFPGGQKDSTDKNLLQTALRETYEEVGIGLEINNILGSLSPIYIPPSNFLVTPFVAYLDTIPDLNPDNKEVQKVLKIALDTLLDSKTMQVKEVISGNNNTIFAPCFYVNDAKIWGATAMILNELLYILKAEERENLAQKKV